MRKLLSIIFFKTMGWKFDVTVPVNSISNCVVIGAPHTTNWDFVFTIFSFWYLKIPFRYFIKDNYTKPWYGFIFKGLGAIGVNRSQRSNLVDYGVELLKEGNDLYLLNTPEGTRSRVEKWKTGFYYIASKAEVPILLGYCDYEKKIAGIGKVVSLENKTKEEVFDEIQDFYKDVKGKYPENYNPKIY